MSAERTYRIVMAVANDMMTDRRVDRHCRALVEDGFEVVVVCREPIDGAAFHAPECALPYTIVRIATRHRRGWRYYAELNRALCRVIAEQDPDVVWANDTDTLLGAYCGRQKVGKGGKVPLMVMDAHEIFPEVPELVKKPLVKAVWRSIERCLMPRCNIIYTVNQSVADYYRNRYHVFMHVVRNLATPNRVGRTTAEGLPMLLYQGCINKGRGIDWAIDMMEWIIDCQLVIAGGGDLEEAMRTYAASKPWHDRITFTGRLAPDELQALTQQAAVGLVMLEDMGLNYHYALPNRIGDFVAAGVPMVVSDLPEMAAVVRNYGVGEVIDGSGARALANAVAHVRAKQWSDADFTRAREAMDWNQEKKRLTMPIRALMGQRLQCKVDDQHNIATKSK